MAGLRRPARERRGARPRRRDGAARTSSAHRHGHDGRRSGLPAGGRTHRRARAAVDRRGRQLRPRHRPAGHALAQPRRAGRRRPAVRRLGLPLRAAPADLRQRAFRQRRRTAHRDRPPATVPARPSRGRRQLVAGRPGRGGQSARRRRRHPRQPRRDGDDAGDRAAPGPPGPDGRRRRPGPHRRSGVPLHGAGAVGERRHRPAVGSHPELGERLLAATATAIADRVVRGRAEEPPLGEAPIPRF